MTKNFYTFWHSEFKIFLLQTLLMITDSLDCRWMRHFCFSCASTFVISPPAPVNTRKQSTRARETADFTECDDDNTENKVEMFTISYSTLLSETAVHRNERMNRVNEKKEHNKPEEGQLRCVSSQRILKLNRRSLVVDTSHHFLSFVFRLKLTWACMSEIRWTSECPTIGDDTHNYTLRVEWSKNWT